MAIWQFECSLVPPISREWPDGVADEEVGWDEFQPPTGFEAVIDSFAPRAESWSDAILMWSDENGDRVQVVLDDGRVAAIACRLDLRAFSEPFAHGIVALTRFCGCQLRDAGGRVFPAEWPRLFAAIRASEALRFVRDPRAFFDALASEPPQGGQH